MTKGRIWQGLPSHNALHRDLRLLYHLVEHDSPRMADVARLDSYAEGHALLDHDTHDENDIEFIVNASRLGEVDN
jgi:hypothetical protein